MKKFLLLLILIQLSSVVYSQNFRINVNTGYSFPMFKQSVEGYYDVLLNDQQNFKTEIVQSFSLGAGSNSEIGLQYNFNENMGIGLDFSYLHGRKILFIHENAIATIISNTEQLLYGRSLRLTPSFYMKTNDYLINPYLKAGIIFSNTTVEMEETTKLNGSVTIIDWEYESKANFGLNFSLGGEYEVKEGYHIRLSCNYQTIAYKPTSASMVNAKQDGNSIIDDYPTVEKEILYTSHYDVAYNQNPDPTKPQILHDIYFPFSSFTVLLGISVNLN